jgi:hypothetical protein
MKEEHCYWSSLNQKSNWALSPNKVKLPILLITIIIFSTFILTVVSVIEYYLLKLPFAYYELQIHAILINDFIFFFTLCFGAFCNMIFQRNALVTKK